MIITVVQFFVIVWLAMWGIGDYLNNQYVKAYVDATIQANQLLIGGVFGVAVVGAVGGLFLKRRGRSTLELVNAKGSGPISTPKVSGKMGGSSGSRSVSSPSPASSVELHPAVAALKAEMSERRMALGMPGMMEQPQGPTAASNAQSNSSSVASALPPDIRQLAQLPRPIPVVSDAPSQSPPMLRTAQPSVQPSLQVVRPSTPSLPVVRPAQPNVPMLRPGPPVPGARPIQPTAPVNRPNPPPAIIPQNVTTVITGIMPKKKDPNDPEEKKQSGQ